MHMLAHHHTHTRTDLIQIFSAYFCYPIGATKSSYQKYVLDTIIYRDKSLTIKKSSWNFSDSTAGNLLRRLETCLSNEFSQAISPAFEAWILLILFNIHLCSLDFEYATVCIPNFLKVESWNGCDLRDYCWLLCIASCIEL